MYCVTILNLNVYYSIHYKYLYVVFNSLTTAYPPIGYERVYLRLYKITLVAITPFHIHTLVLK